MEEQPAKHTVLVVDDIPDNIHVLSEALRSEYKVKAALSGEKALEIADAKPRPDLILLDIMMPGMDGMEVLDKIRQTHSSVNLPVIMVTAKDESRDIVKALECGANDYITKPIDTPVALARVRTHLALKSATTALEQALAAEKVLLERTLAGSVKVMSDSLSLVAPDAFRNASRVWDWVRRLAGPMNVGPRWELNIAAMLAPLGMIGIPRDVLIKANAKSPLSDEEQELLSQVPELGRVLVANIPRLEGVAEIIQFADERFDGASLAEGSVSGQDIPPGSRLLKILFDLAKITESHLPRKEDFEHLERHGEWYDPSLLETVRSRLETRGEEDADERSWIEIKVRDLQVGDILKTPLTQFNGKVFLAKGLRVTALHTNHLKLFNKVLRIIEPVRVIREGEGGPNGPPAGAG